jgi:hypothetical protein
LAEEEEEEEEEERSAKITAPTSNRSNRSASQRSQFSPSIQQDVFVVVVVLLLCVHCKFLVDLLPVSHGCLFFDGLERRTERPSDRRPQQPRNVVLLKKAGEGRRWTSIRFLDVRD